MVLDKNKSWQYFFEIISAIPHPSGNEKKLADFLEAFARNRKLRYYRDSIDNIVIYKPASCGYEYHPTVILQGHMDMVCEKTKFSNFNFNTDALELYLDGEWIRAKNTSLGADDGIATAYMLSVLADDALLHPPLECIFTVQEETTMYGASNLNPTVLTGKRMIGLDASGEKTTLICSAGGLTLECTIPILNNFLSMNEQSLTDQDAFTISVDGIRPCHSAKITPENNWNALKLVLDYFIYLSNSGINSCLINICGGTKDNTLPTSASLTILTDQKLNTTWLNTSMASFIKNEYPLLLQSNPAFHYNVEKIRRPENIPVMNDIAVCLSGLPVGILSYSTKYKDLIDTSVNLASIVHKDKQLKIRYLIRSFSSKKKYDIAKCIESTIEKFNGTMTYISSYPEWEALETSHMRETLVSIFSEIYKEPLLTKTNHGGTEYGIFSKSMPDIDIATIGPIWKNIHTYKEALHLPSFDRVYMLLIHYLAAL